MAKFEVKTQNGKSFILKDEDEIHRGGEGRIMLMPAKTGLVAKIYLTGINTITQERFEQLKALDKELFVKPIDLLYQNGKIIGYSMEYAGKDYFPLSTLFSQNFITRNGITDQFKQKIALKLIDAVKSAHFSGFVIGDLNQFNVLINLNGNVKFIDVDSYETPGYKHTGILLDDIRDYYYQGQVNMNSDYFALSVLLFSMFTYMHPFKGIHQKYKTLGERMIHKIPVFYDDPMLKVPKCYQPIENDIVQQEFNKLYLQGQRFLIDVAGSIISRQIKKPQLVNVLNESDLKIQIVLIYSKIRNVSFNQTFGFIETEKQILVFKAIAKGNLRKVMELEKKQFDEVFIGNQNVIAREKQHFYLLNEQGKHTKIQNFKIPDEGNIHQLGNILIVLCQGQMYWVYIDEVLNNSIRNKRIEVFSESFSLHSGFIQNTGGVQRIFYNTGKDIASVKIGVSVKKVFQQGNTGIIQFIDNKKLVNKFFRISGLNFELIDIVIESITEFGYFIDAKENGFVFEPGENHILIRRTADFEVVSEVPCNLVSNQTALFYSTAGIVVWDMDKVFLVNQQ
jgi:hypothetical protein